MSKISSTQKIKQRKTGGALLNIVDLSTVKFFLPNKKSFPTNNQIFVFMLFPHDLPLHPMILQINSSFDGQVHDLELKGIKKISLDIFIKIKYVIIYHELMVTLSDIKQITARF